MASKITFWLADEVGEIAESLIPQFHEHVGGFAMLYVFRSKAVETNGRKIWGKARKIGGLNAYLACRGNYDPKEPASPTLYVIEIAHDVWNTLKAPERIALVDHELSHIADDGTLNGHDVEEFAAVVARHGRWHRKLGELLDASKQQPLFEPAAEPSC